jgi:two-component system, response regulator PdtaR
MQMPGDARSPTISDGEAPSGPARDGLRVLIAEDEYLLGLSLQEDLRSAGCTTLGPFSDVAETTEAVVHESFDVAVLDINLNGRMIYPVADELTARGIPVLFLTGYGGENLPEQYRDWPRVSKPYDPLLLMREIRRLTSRDASPGV